MNRLCTLSSRYKIHSNRSFERLHSPRILLSLFDSYQRTEAVDILSNINDVTSSLRFLWLQSFLIFLPVHVGAVAWYRSLREFRWSFDHIAFVRTRPIQQGLARLDLLVLSLSLIYIVPDELRFRRILLRLNQFRVFFIQDLIVFYKHACRSCWSNGEFDTHLQWSCSATSTFDLPFG